jgi:hypothetical protein
MHPIAIPEPARELFPTGAVLDINIQAASVIPVAA